MSAISKMITPDGAAYDIRDANALRAAAAAPSFSDSASYAEGDYVTHDGLLYRATAARVAGAWNSGSGFELVGIDSLLARKLGLYPFALPVVTSETVGGSTTYTVTVAPSKNNQLDLTTNANSGITAFTVAFSASSVANTMRDLWLVVKSGSTAPTITWPSGTVEANDDSDNLLAEASAVTVFTATEYTSGKFIVARQVLASSAVGEMVISGTGELVDDSAYPFVMAEVSSGALALAPFANNQLDLTTNANSGITAFTVAISASSVLGAMRDLWLVVKSGVTAPTITWPPGFEPANDDDDNLVAEASATTVFLLSEYAPNKFLIARQVVEVQE